MIKGVDYMTIEELFSRVRRRERITRGAFKGMLRRAQRSGLVQITGIQGEGVCVVLMEMGKLGLADLIGDVRPDVARAKSFVENGGDARSL